MCCVSRVHYAFEGREHVRSRYVDHLCHMWKWQRRAPAWPAQSEHRLPTKEKDEMQKMKMALIEKHLGNLSVDRLLFLTGRTEGDLWSQKVIEKKGQERGVLERARKYRDWKGGKGVAQVPLQSKWSILSFLLCVRGCPRRWWWLCRRQARRPLLWPRLSSTFLRKWGTTSTTTKLWENSKSGRKTNDGQPSMAFRAWGQSTSKRHHWWCFIFMHGKMTSKDM